MTGLYVDSIKDASNTKTLATLSSSAINLSTDVTVPATTSACEKLYANDVSGVANISVDGYFDDTKYGFYEMHLKNVRISSADTGKELAFRANTGGSADSSGIYWSAAGGNYNSDGDPYSFDRADNDGGSSANMDNTWSLANSGQTSRSASYFLKFSNPQKTDRYKLFHVISYGNSHQNEATYDAWVSNKVISVVTNTALTGVTFFMLGSTSTILQAEILLLGFRK